MACGVAGWIALFSIGWLIAHPVSFEPVAISGLLIALAFFAWLY